MIDQVPVKKLVEFMRLSDDRLRTSYANRLKTPKPPKLDDEESGGGNYWTRSISAICNASRKNDNSFLQNKIDEVTPLFEASDNELTKQMYKRNLEILHSYLDFNFSTLFPDESVKFLAKSKLPLVIKGVPIKVIPTHVFTYGDKDEPNIGGAWFIIWLKKFKQREVAMYSEALYQYLSSIYSDKYKVDPYHCLVMDVLSMQTVTYSQIVDDELPSSLENTIDTLNRYL